MRLAELEPRWVTGIRGKFPEAEGKRGHIGLTFLCPHCRTQRLGILFDPPIDDDVLWLFASWSPFLGDRWQREGETFDSISLTPSIDASESGHWHGFITDGEIK